MTIEEYKKELTNWKVKHTDFYNEYVHAVKCKRATLTTYMHIYEFAMTQIPSLPEGVEVGACDDLFTIYYNRYGFNKLIGMLTTVWANDKILGIKSLAQREKFKKAIVSWLVIGDLHTCIVNKVYSYPDKANYEESLRKLLRRIIRNSIIIGLKDKGFWNSQHIRTKLPFSEEALYEILMIDIQTNAPTFSQAIVDVQIDGNANLDVQLGQEEIATTNPIERHPLVAPSEESIETNEKDSTRPIANPNKRKSNRGRKSSFRNLREQSLASLIETVIDKKTQIDLETLSKEILDKIKNCKEDKERAPLVVALEICGLIPVLSASGGVKGFCNILFNELGDVVQYRTFVNHYNSYASLRDRVPKEDIIVQEKNLKEIINWKKTFQEILVEATKSAQN